MWTWKFWADAFDRAFRTFAQVIIPALSTAAALHIDWRATLTLAAHASILSVLTSVAFSGVGPKGTAAIITPGTYTGGEHAA